MVGNTGANLFYPFCNSTQAKCNGHIVTEGNGLSYILTRYLGLKCKNQIVTRYIATRTF
jgi:hypothetical protein